ncbi:O-antigen/teichoic acid export membrane protein [Faecalicoccus acidiformans]|uniref:O-antigen/teichoic acid export membrane protein n=1 Tax=Faecalicoccus acidiformans TaxID=915173 RepID=A0A7W8D1V7_9FIRM|nr:oligosaccharide flippase family protein [Faecalicoccus acidiformans]MBB5185715.1 O-antigen/teichoic acid export membrane protein [Faecalicoccus acidiformans]
MKDRFFIINLICQLIVFCSNMIINFFLTPYVLEKLGTEAYGFIGLINNFVSYINIITIALNSMAGRYITLSYHKSKKEEAEEYFSSVFFANVVLSLLVFFAMIVLLINVTSLLNIPYNLIEDVQITIIFSCINTIVSLLAVVFGIAAFIKNKLYKNSITQMVSALVRVFVMIFAFVLFQAHMWYYSLAALIATFSMMLLQMKVTKSLCPELSVKKNKLRWEKVIRIVKSGVWVSVESFNKILQTGLDLLIANLFVGANATGVLSVSKTIPNVLVQITTTITSVFNPELAKLYAEGKFDDLKDGFLFTIRFLSLLMIVPLVGFIVFGNEFYSLWLPERSLSEIDLIQTLSVLSLLPLLVNAYVEGLYYANTLTNKIKGSVLITLFFSVMSIVVEFVLLNITNINPLYIIAGTSSFFLIIRYLLVTPLYSAYVLNLPLLSFFPALLKAILVSLIVYGSFYLVKSFVMIDSWITFLIVCGSCGVIGYLMVFILLLNSREKKKVKTMIVRRKNGNSM